MGANAIWWPAVAMVLLTFVVWCRMYVVRIGEMQRKRIHPQALSTPAKVAERLDDSRASDNFRNLFELPVLLYAAVCVAAIAGLVDTVTLVLAWLFVALRAVHSIIQCSYNKVMHRFHAYLAGAVALFSLWGVLAYRLLQG